MRRIFLLLRRGLASGKHSKLYWVLEFPAKLLRKVGEAISRYDMIREGDRIAVGLSGGKDSVTLLECLVALSHRSPVKFTVEAFTIEQGKFLAPIAPFGDYLRDRGIRWRYFTDGPSLRLLEDQPGHGCDVCSRFRRRAVYEVAKELGVNVIALGHTADDFCESFLRNAMFTGQLSALPPVTWSRERDFRLIRPLVFVAEDMTTEFARSAGAPVIPCGCSQKTGTVRRSIRDIFAELEREHPRLKETLLAAMGNINPERLLDPRFHNRESPAAPEELLAVLTEF
jgi:tRNA 2-thiocytidine biosynthesis protein TtcA